MPGYVKNPNLPEDIDPQQASVFDPLYKTLLRKAVSLAGLDDPTTAISGAMGPMAVAAPEAKLAMDKLSRMARAKAQGFTEPVYHATNAKTDFKQFLPDADDMGIHVTPEVATATNVVAKRPSVNDIGKELNYKQNARIMPLLARMQKTLELPDIGYWKSPLSWRASLEGFPVTKPASTAPRKSVFDETIQTNDSALARALYEKAKGSLEGNRGNFVADVRDMIRKAGYDSIKYANHAEGAGEPSYMLLDPRQVRSKFAAFDPEKFGKSKDLMASVAAAVGLGSTMRDK